MDDILPEEDIVMFELHFLANSNSDIDNEELNDLEIAELDCTELEQKSEMKSQNNTSVLSKVEPELRDIFSSTGTDLFHENGELVTYDILENGCGCQRNCVSKFTKSDIILSHLSCLEMNYYCQNHINHLNVYSSGALNALVRTGDTMQKGHKPKNRQAAYTEYQFHGIVVCKNMFQFVNGLGDRRLRRSKSLFLLNGVQETVHKNSVIQSRCTVVSLPARQKAVKFITNFAQNNALVLPGRVPMYHHTKDLLLLSSTMTKKYVYNKYVESEKQFQALSLHMWYITWNEFCQNIVIQRPRSDLCVICQQSIMSMRRLLGMEEDVKRERIEESLHHLRLVENKRCYYREVINNCKINLTEELIQESLRKIPVPCSLDKQIHISFDYAQQILLPSSNQQVGPIYFLTGYKVALFGIAVEPIHKFYLYIIPEACAIGKGANAVISFLHHFFENFSLGENEIICHADNCAGQNKNRYVLQSVLPFYG